MPLQVAGQTPVGKLDHNLWHQTAKYIPQEGHAIVWFAPDGQQIDGCVVYEERQLGVLRTEYTEVHWLPLLTYNSDHRRDVPISYLPALWRYK